MKINKFYFIRGLFMPFLEPLTVIVLLLLSSENGFKNIYSTDKENKVVNIQCINLISSD